LGLQHFLTQTDSNKNFLLGSATTVTAVLGSILSGADAARSLAGAAGVLSGIRSEYNEAYFSGLAAHVIAKGIEIRQEEAYRHIQTKGQGKSILAYPLEAAVKDAIYFDGLCSVVQGLDQASASVDATTEPGIEAAMRTVLRARLLKDASEVSKESLLDPKTIDSFEQAGKKLGLSLLGSARDGKSEISLLDAVDALHQSIRTGANNASNTIADAAVKRFEELTSSSRTDAEKKTLASAKGTLVPKITQAILGDFQLDNCYDKLARADDVEHLDAQKVLVQATDETGRINAESRVKKAEAGIETTLKKIDLAKKKMLARIKEHQEERITAIKAVGTRVFNDVKNAAEVPLTYSDRGAFSCKSPL